MWSNLSTVIVNYFNFYFEKFTRISFLIQNTWEIFFRNFYPDFLSNNLIDKIVKNHNNYENIIEL